MSLSSYPGKVLIYGGRGALGAACVTYFKKKCWWVGSIDMKVNDEAHVNIVVNPGESWGEQETFVLNEVKQILNDQLVDAVICVAGGWAGGNASSKDFIKHCELMWKQSVWSSTIAARLAAEHLKEGGLITLPGAKPALDATPGMIGYGMAKAAVHQLTKSLSSKDSGLPSGVTVLALLPIILDTPANRKWMPETSDTSKWTPLEFVSELLFKWSQGIDRPDNGSLVSLITKENITELTVV